MHGDAEAGQLGATEELLVLGDLEVVRLWASNVDADDAAALPGDRLLHDDLVLRVGEATVEAEDQTWHHWVLERGAVGAANCRGDDVVKVLLAVAIALHWIEAQLHGGDVVLAIGTGDHLVHRSLHGDW